MRCSSIELAQCSAVPMCGSRRLQQLVRNTCFVLSTRAKSMTLGLVRKAPRVGHNQNHSTLFVETLGLVDYQSQPRRNVSQTFYGESETNNPTAPSNASKITIHNICEATITFTMLQVRFHNQVS